MFNSSKKINLSHKKKQKKGHYDVYVQEESLQDSSESLASLFQDKKALKYSREFYICKSLLSHISDFPILIKKKAF